MKKRGINKALSLLLTVAMIVSMLSLGMVTASASTTPTLAPDATANTITATDVATGAGGDGIAAITSVAFVSTALYIGDATAGSGTGAFNGCTLLETVTINAEMESIGDYAFEGCTNLATVIFEGDTPPDFGEGVFDGCYSAILYAPYSVAWFSLWQDCLSDISNSIPVIVLSDDDDGVCYFETVNEQSLGSGFSFSAGEVPITPFGPQDLSIRTDDPDIAVNVDAVLGIFRNALGSIEPDEDDAEVSLCNPELLKIYDGENRLVRAYILVKITNGDDVRYHAIQILSETFTEGSTNPLPPMTITPQATANLYLNGVPINAKVMENGCLLVDKDNLTAAQLALIVANAVDGSLYADFDADLYKGIQFDLVTSMLISMFKLTMTFTPYGNIWWSGSFISGMLGAKLYGMWGFFPGSLIVDAKVDGEALDWYDEQDPSLVMTPYAPGETDDEDLVVMYRILANGTKRLIPRSMYQGGYGFAKIYGLGEFETGAAAPMNFTDIAGGWMEKAANFASARGIIYGIGGGLFDPDTEVTRAHYVTMLMRMLDIAPTGVASTGYSDDADIPAWAYGAVKTAEELGFIPDIFDGAFMPNAPMTREDMFTITYNALVYMGLALETGDAADLAFDDTDMISGYSLEAIATLAKNGLVNGMGDNLVDPQGTPTRAQAAQLICNIIKYDFCDADGILKTLSQANAKFR